MAYDIVIVGGGIVGLATGRELLNRYPGLKLAVLEKETAIASHQTGHNSGVIHSGIYYKPGSLKAKLCVEGRRSLWAYCEQKGIAYKQVGKLIVATEEYELPLLDDLYQRGLANGIEDIEIIDAAGIREREPHCRGIKAIFSPVTGIIDYGLVANAYAGDVKSLGGDIFTGRVVTSIERRNNTSVIKTSAGEYESRYVITCGGLQSDRLAKMTGGANDPKIVPFRGDYLILKPEKRAFIKGNIYPVPDPNFPFLGVHFTPRMNGDIWLGPNAVLAFAREGYSFSTINAGDLVETLTYSGFVKLVGKYANTGVAEMYRDVVRGAYVKALQRYIPDLQVEDTLPGPSGVRAQAMMPDGTLVDDFVFDGNSAVMHVRNAPSPAATSSLAIGRYIADDAEKRFDLGTAHASGARMRAISYHTATEYDLEAMLDLFARVADERLWIGAEPDFDRAAYRANWLQLLRDPNCVMINAMDGGRIIGNAAVFLSAKGQHVLGMLVDVTYRRRGVGRALLNAVIDWAREHGVPALRLEVFPHNQAAISLYRELGFEEIARKQGHVVRSDGSLWDTILMQRTFP